MKKYIAPAAHICAALTPVFALVLAAGFTLFALRTDCRQLALVLILTAAWCLPVPLMISIIEYCCPICLDEQKIIFPAVRINLEGKNRRKPRGRRFEIPYRDIGRIRTKLLKGIPLLTGKDTRIYTFYLKDGRKFTLTLSGYGKRPETEISSMLRSHVSSFA